MRAVCWISCLILVGWVSLYGSFCLLAGENITISYYRDPKAIINEVSKRGADVIVSELYSTDEAWKFVLRNIAVGTEPWLKVAVALHPGSDAGASEMLNLSVGEALENTPENVFRFTLQEFQLNTICSGVDIDDPRYNSYELSMKAIKRRQDRIAGISHPDLRDVAKRCIQILEESKAGIAKYYGIKNY